MSPPAQCDTSNHSSDDFVVHISSKIEKIRTDTAGDTARCYCYCKCTRASNRHPFNYGNFTVKLQTSRCCWDHSLLSRTPSKHCQLDPVPTWLIKHVAVILAPFLSLMCNTSLLSGQFPDSHKHAVIFPRLKNHSILTIWTLICQYRTSVSFLSSSKESYWHIGFQSTSASSTNWGQIHIQKCPDYMRDLVTSTATGATGARWTPIQLLRTCCLELTTSLTAINHRH